MPPSDAPPYDRSRVEAALVEVSHLLVSSSDVDLRQVLRALGEAVGAEYAYLVTTSWGAEAGPETLQRGALTVWHRDGPEAEAALQASDAEPPLVRLPLLGGDGLVEGRPAVSRLVRRGERGETERLAIPILSEHDRFVGYLGIERARLPEETLREHSDVLSIFGDLLASYFGRVSAERALRESEERWRKLVGYHPEPILVTANDVILYANEACARLLGAQRPEDLLAYTLHDFLPADQGDLIEAQRNAQLLQLSDIPFEHEVVRLDGEERIVEALSVAVTFRGRAAIQTVLRDVTERKASEERYRTFVQTISEGVWRVDLEPPISTLAAPALQVEHILQHGRLAECNATMAEMMGPARARGAPDHPLEAVFPFLPRPLLETFVRSGYRLQHHEFSVAQPEGPLRHYAVNAVGRLDRGQLIRIWGSCVDVTARVEMERRMVAALEEQQERIGQDLHDGVGQLLTGIRMMSDNLVARLTATERDEATLEVARKIGRFAYEAAQRVREICRGLAPPQLFQESLAYALESLTTHADSCSETRCTFSWDTQAEVYDREAKLQLYRIAQEAVNNALKHARAAHIRVRLALVGEDVALEVEDDGVGFDVDTEQGRSIGLYSMQRRASSVRAHLTVSSRPGRTLVRVLLPVAAAHGTDAPA